MNTAQTTKNLAQKIARQIAQEPLEVLKDVGEQTSVVRAPEKQEQPEKTKEPQDDPIEKARMVRRMEAYQRELEDIRKQDKFGELQRRISQGEEIPLEDYPELTVEQKQVLRAQMEAVRNQIRSANHSNDNQLTEPAAKKGRRFFNFGKKTAMKREQTHVEKPAPPSG